MGAHSPRRSDDSPPARIETGSTQLRLPPWLQEARYPTAYTWYVLACFLDLILTNTIISHFGGQEVNFLAAHAINVGGFWGLIAFKIASMVVVLILCQFIGHRRDRTGRRVVVAAVVFSALPVVVGMAQLQFDPEIADPGNDVQVLAWMDR